MLVTISNTYCSQISSAVSDGIPAALPEPLGRRCPRKVLQAAEKKALGRRQSPQRRGVRQEWRGVSRLQTVDKVQTSHCFTADI